ncbi:hypothetical protein CGZ69_30865 [Streptomyces peucetius subsp. caesius ATCC 27952]|nr:hypothetical protein CGZ69_30865 [Streptomyces peucetius subsp. caesius ATCC 27952]
MVGCPAPGSGKRFDQQQTAPAPAARETVHVRDSKDRTRPHLSVGAAHWTVFVTFASR